MTLTRGTQLQSLRFTITTLVLRLHPQGQVIITPDNHLISLPRRSDDESVTVWRNVLTTLSPSWPSGISVRKLGGFNLDNMQRKLAC